MMETLLIGVTLLICSTFLILWLRSQLLMHFMNSQARLDAALSQTRQELHTRFQSLEGQVGGRLDSLGQEGFKHFEKVQQHLAAAELKLASLNTVGQSISELNQLLKLPHLRGGFGEATLERLLADYLPVGAYEMEYMITPGSTERVDAVVKMARQVLPIDSKFPREQVLPLFDSQIESELEAARATLCEVIKGQARSIASKYIRPEHGTTDMALMFLPSETLYFEVIRNTALFEFLAKNKVFPVSPNTLAIALHSVTIAQEYYEMARGVERTIEDVKKARRHFEHFERKFEDVGRGIKKAQEAYETAHTHLSHYESSVYRLTGSEQTGAEPFSERTIPMPEIIARPESRPE